MAQTRTRVTILLNCIAKQMPVAAWDDIEIDASQDLYAIARRNLLHWYTECGGDLEPAVRSGPNDLVPDEVVIRTPRGRPLARWNIVDEMNARCGMIGTQ